MKPLNDPLTKMERRSYWKELEHDFNVLYERALKAPNLPEQSEGSYNLAKSVLIVLAEKQVPVSQSGKRLLKKIRSIF